MAEQINWENQDSLEDVKIILAKILRKWHWVVLALAIAITTAVLYIRYQDSVYVVKASFITMKFDNRKASMMSDLTGFGSLSERIEINQQIPLLKSENRIIETLRRLDFDISYFVEGRMKATEIYNSNSYKVFNQDSSVNIPYNQSIYLEKINEHSYSLYSENEQFNQNLIDRTFLFDANQNINGWLFNISHDQGNDINPDYDYFFIIHHPTSLMNSYRSKLNINWAMKGSAILNVSMNSEIPQKDYDFLNTYLKVIIDLGLEEKNEYLVNSIQFIDDYMLDITDTLLNYQIRLDQFRLSIRDIVSGSELIIDRLNKLDDEKAQLTLENSYYNYIEDYIQNNREESVFAPNLIGLQAPPLQELVGQYMQGKWDEQQDKNEFNEKNPLVIKGDEQFGKIEENIYESVKNLRQLNHDKINEIEKKSEFFLSSVSDLQVEYREYAFMDRMKILYEELHNQLLARRTDAYISKASATSDYQIVTAPNYSNVPIYPNKNKIFMFAIAFGLGLPIGLIFLIDLINPKVVSKEDLKKHSDIPIIGSVGHFKGQTDLVVYSNPKSQVAESFRLIRANLEYIDSENKEVKIVVITSSISGEGKTFCSINLAYTYANMGKRTLLIGGDMRRPALAKNFDLERAHGLSNYLSGQDALEGIIYSTNHSGLDVIPGGHVPPNPAELLSTKRMTELMEFVKAQYSVIVIDTPPLGIVSDTMELIKHSFTPILIVRQNVTYKKSLDAVTEMHHAGRFKNLGIIMNDVNFSRYDYGAYYGRDYGYGSGDGYGYYDEDKKKKKFWKRIF